MNPKRAAKMDREKRFEQDRQKMLRKKQKQHQGYNSNTPTTSKKER
jgi:hypothetical protein